jgi:hypothetical protein
MDDLSKLGPLEPLAGVWEGDQGVDFSYHHDDQVTGDTHYREETALGGFGPVDNGAQCLFGLDYRMAAWRGDEVDPFHTEVGYWLWDADLGLVMRCFMVPRGTVMLAGGPAEPDSTSFTMTADLGSSEHGILQNPYLTRAASSVRYEVTVTVNADGTWGYVSDTVLSMNVHDGELHHTDRNILHRADG